MAQFGLRDHLGGGFFRYSTDTQWRILILKKCFTTTLCLDDL